MLNITVPSYVRQSQYLIQNILIFSYVGKTSSYEGFSWVITTNKFTDHEVKRQIVSCKV